MEYDVTTIFKQNSFFYILKFFGILITDKVSSFFEVNNLPHDEHFIICSSLIAL